MSMNIKPAFRYQVKDLLVGSAVFLGVIVLIMIAACVSTWKFNGNICFTGYGITTAICLFVFGIVTPRPTLRLCIQFGISRRTAFFSQLLAVMVDCLFLAIAGNLLFEGFSALSHGGVGLHMADLYQLLYLQSNELLALTTGQFLKSILLDTAIAFCFFCMGMFFTYLFWRLNKVWKIVVAISIPIVINGVPAITFRLSPKLVVASGRFLNVMSASVWNFILFWVLLSVVLSAVDWLLLRRANIKEPTSR